MIVQKFVVLLSETPVGTTGHDVRQIWLGYDDMGRIGNCNFDQAFRYDTKRDAVFAMLRAKMGKGGRKWSCAELFGVCEEIKG